MSYFDNYHLTGKYDRPWDAFHPERGTEGVKAEKVQDVYYSSDKLL